MADFSYCHGEACPLRNRCVRYRRFEMEKGKGILSEWQSYLAEPYDKDADECESFILFQTPVS